MTEALLSRLAQQFPLRALDVGEMGSLKANGMTFTVEAYEAEGLGHVSVMRATGFFGLMKMDTLIVNPTALDLPLYSYDRIYAMGNDTLIVELYDSQLSPFAAEGLAAVKAAYTDLPERDPGAHWYDEIKLAESLSKKGKRADTARLNELATAHWDAYLNAPAAVADAACKRAKAAVYVEGLLQNGGPSTDVFKRSLGDEKTAQLFRKVLFGTDK
ncbi:MAG: hypothetical protein IJC17_07445 [Clostridia bacterium]|nr:hypothetical protein [Clostridia bacterium]